MGPGCRLFLVMLLLLSPVLARAGEADNPVPAAGDLLLPLPGGGVMAFRPVCLNSGESYFAWRRFTMGDPSAGYKETPTAVALGGAFRAGGGGRDGWCYYLGKYEVSQAQFAAVMGQDPPADPALPARKVSWFDVQDFIRRYNDFLFSGHADALPDYGGQPGFLRLPTEEEWEFAARGGAAVDSEVFDRRYPYDSGNLAAFEWFSGPKSSHNKVQPIGRLKPNPLGLHDMLGNVAEMTATLYRVEYYQGRSGGFTARGGHVYTQERQVRASMRTEQPFYRWERGGKVRPNAQATLGFRLAISSLVFPSREVSQGMKEEWASYRAGSGGTLPAAASTAPASVRTGAATLAAARRLERLERLLEQAGSLDESSRREIGFLRADLDKVRAEILRAEEDSAYSWIKIAGEQAMFIRREHAKLPTADRLIRIARQAGDQDKLARYEKKRQEIQDNISRASATYVESIRRLGGMREEPVSQGFDRYVTFLMNNRAVAQVQVLQKVMAHARDFRKAQRVRPDAWQRDIVR